MSPGAPYSDVSLAVEVTRREAAEREAEIYRAFAEEISRRAALESQLRSSLARQTTERKALTRELTLREKVATAKAERRIAKLREALIREAGLRELAEQELRSNSVRGGSTELTLLRDQATQLSQRVDVLRRQLAVRETRVRELEEDLSGQEVALLEARKERDEHRLWRNEDAERQRALLDRKGEVLSLADELLTQLQYVRHTASSLGEGVEKRAREPKAHSLAQRMKGRRATKGERTPGPGPEVIQTAAALQQGILAYKNALETLLPTPRATRAGMPSGKLVDESSPIAMPYQTLVADIARTVAERIPVNASLAIISKGDPQLVDMGGRRVMHFPQGEDGQYAGYYPFDSGAAINHLEEVRERGAQFLIVPATAFWWMDHYSGFRDHLEFQYEVVVRDSSCIVFDLQHVLATPSNVETLSGVGTDVICFPIIDWDFRFQRSQQLLSEFAAHGHRVFYVQTSFQSHSESPTIREIDSAIYGVQLSGPPHMSLYRDSMDPGDLEKILKSLDQLRRAAGISRAVCIVSLPFWAPLALAAREEWAWRVVYDCMDDHSGFSTNGPAMLRLEETLTAESDLVLTSSQHLHDRVDRDSGVLLLRNAADFQHFAVAPEAQPLGDVGRPVIGYFGAISEWFDVEMVYHAAKARPDWTFVLIGDTFGADVEWLSSLANVSLLGEQPYAVLPSYLHQFDVACIPFRLTPLTAATNPVKFYEYLSAGKPVVAVDLPELAPYRDYYYGTIGADFVEQIARAIEEDSPERRRARVEFARGQTWAHRYTTLMAKAGEWYEKASIVILTYTDDPKYVSLCLESIWAETDYPNFEVVVVDNGSSSTVCDYLRSAAAVEGRLRVIFNEENLGFAKGNNIGIHACTDAEYVVLLNDDTVVTPGWLSKIVRYLSDERIGMVGPVTNWTGNEARIEVSYRDLEHMRAFAAEYTKEHAGESFDIDVLAMFCVGIRKRLIDRLGGLDERFGIGMFEDDDYALRLRNAWYRVVCAEDIFVHHWGRASMSRLDEVEYRELFERNKRYFEEKWGPWTPHQARKGIREEFSWQPH